MLYRTACAEVTDVYTNPESLHKLNAEWSRYVRANGKEFFPDRKDFDYDVKNFLYYRARAITEGVPNINGDLFMHPDLKPAYTSFVGKGIYFNHDSSDPKKAFGIILDAVYTPIFYGDDAYKDKYVEILGAVHRGRCKELHPELLGDITSGRISSTSMGVMAKWAQCSICGNIAHDTQTLCTHVDPGTKEHPNPFYCKGRTINGSLCYETNHDLTFFEDSFVYLGADPTAKILEIYASASADMTPLMEHLTAYSRATGRVVPRESIFIYSGVNMTSSESGKSVVAAEKLSDIPVTPAPVPPGPVVAPAPAPAETLAKDKQAASADKATTAYQSALTDATNLANERSAKVLNDTIVRVVDESLRKHIQPLRDAIEHAIRPDVDTAVAAAVERAVTNVEAVLPGISSKIDGKGPTTTGAELSEEDKGEVHKQSSVAAPVGVNITEDFSTWEVPARVRLIAAVQSGAKFTFKGEVK